MSRVIKVSLKKTVSSLRYLSACQLSSGMLTELRTICSLELQLPIFLLCKKSELTYYNVEVDLVSTCSCDLTL